jgi:mono/diheme cytochrome c family protein
VRAAPAVLAAALGALTACATAGRAGGAPASPGEALYRSRCAACHRLRDPGERTGDAWVAAIERYGPRAHLDPAERREVLAYLRAHARDAPPAASSAAPR